MWDLLLQSWVIWQQTKENKPSAYQGRDNVTILFKSFSFSRFISGPSSAPPMLIPKIGQSWVVDDQKSIEWSERKHYIIPAQVSQTLIMLACMKQNLVHTYTHKKGGKGFASA